MSTKPLKIIFAGTPEFAASAFEKLLSTSHQVIAVYTQPDRPAGRGLALVQSPVKMLAEKHHIPVFQPQSLKDPAEQAKLQALQADLMVVAAYGLLLPKAVLSAPRLGCINIHASLLPRWRGASPIQRAILAGDAESGITIMQMDEGMDTGPMLYKLTCPLEAEETAESLHDKLAALGGQALLHVLSLIDSDRLKAQAQDPSTATPAPKLHKEEARLNWQLSAEALERQVRAFNPWPVAFTQIGDKTLRIFKAKALAENSSLPPGTITHSSAQGLDIACKEGQLRLLEVQLPGSKRLSIADFLNSRQAEFAVSKHFD